MQQHLSGGNGVEISAGSPGTWCQSVTLRGDQSGVIVTTIKTVNTTFCSPFCASDDSYHLGLTDLQYWWVSCDCGSEKLQKLKSN